MKEVELPRANMGLERASFLACLATILELPVDQLPSPAAGEDVVTGWTIPRWLGGLGMGLVPVAHPATFSWAGPWIARVSPPAGNDPRYVVMYGVPSGLVWDPGGDGDIERNRIDQGFVVAAADIALARPVRSTAPHTAGTVEAIYIAAAAGQSAQHADAVQAHAGRGLEGDRHAVGSGTFPSGVPGSALTLIEAEVCQSFNPPLQPDEHRRNLVTRGIALNGLVGREFTVGSVRCRGMRLCEPCLVMERYASRPVLRDLVHRGGLRADILSDGELRCGDSVQVASDSRQ
jgi:MOSC domain-containing protein YiiM